MWNTWHFPSQPGLFSISATCSTVSRVRPHVVYLDLRLDWLPRLQDVEAGSLTNEAFGEFLPHLRQRFDFVLAAVFAFWDGCITNACLDPTSHESQSAISTSCLGWLGGVVLSAAVLACRSPVRLPQCKVVGLECLACFLLLCVACALLHVSVTCPGVFAYSLSSFCAVF